MKAHFPVFCALLVASSAFADPYMMARQQAVRTSDQNNAEQARIQNATGPAAAAASTPAPAPMDPALQATLQNIGDLQGNFAVFINADGQPDPAQKTSLLNNLSHAAQSTKASSDSVKKLAADLTPALSQRKKLTAAQQKKLAVDVHAVFNSSHLSAAQQKMMFDDVQKILTEAGAAQGDIDGVVTDLKKITDETK
ncbi:MAG TPA: hypothetical protein VK815_13230 [Candidatus Acidoferrales bacterium]|jgi:hypothetical protein|nr:hypothetical protein [Candidatus Acidoferrales bacterium]